jgi:hypothetical protein
LSQNVGRTLAFVLILSFGLPLLLTVFILEWFGVGQYVYPILIPIFGGIAFVFVFVFGIVCFAVRASVGRTTQLQGSVHSGYEAQEFTRGDYFAPRSPGSVFVIPTYCPHCQEGIELHRAGWSGSMNLICSNCGHLVNVSISEESP